MNLLQYVVQPAMNCYQIIQPIQMLRQCGTRIEAKLLSPQTANLLTPHIHAYLSFLAVISRHTWYCYEQTELKWRQVNLGYRAGFEVRWTDCSSGDWYFTNPGPVFMSRTKLYKRVSIKSKCKKKTNPRRNLFTHETRKNWGNL